MGRIVAFDPGGCTGWALFEGAELAEAGTGTRVGDCDLGGAIIAIIEKPLIYPIDSKGDPNDLITLAIRAGEIGGWTRCLGIEVQYVTPRQWKGTTPKDISHRRILGRLSNVEKQRLPKLPKSKAHNMLDAVGIGLWWLEKGNLRP